VTEASVELQALCDQGVALHLQGQVEAARRCYDAVLRADPAHFDALHMLGVACLQAGQADISVALIERALAARPGEAAAHSNLATALTRLGRPEAAIASCERAIALHPDFAEAHSNLGDALHALGRPGDAARAYEAAIALKPAYAVPRYNLGRALFALKRPEDALASYEAAIALSADYAEAHNNRGVVLAALDRPEAALASFERAIALRPDAAEPHNNRGKTLIDLNRPEEALASYQRATQLKPDFAEAWNNLGSAQLALQRGDAALASYDRAVALGPDDAEAWNNRGIALYGARRLDEALASCETAISLKPDFAEAHYYRALSLLALGRLGEGFGAYAWRWRVAGRNRPILPGRLWEGESLAGKSILVHCEQGYGDSLQFIRYARPLAAMAARLTVLAPAPLVRLFRSIPGLEVCSALVRDDIDFHVPLMCLPRLLGTTLATIPAEVPYLAPEPADIARWTERLGAREGSIRVGLVWAGDSRRQHRAAHAIDRRRSLRLAQFAPLGEVARARFFSLQKGEPAAQALTPPGGLRLIDWTDELHDFADTAALIAGLDLVITVDTAVAHLAGALARPVWVLSRFDGCWRWLNGRADSPWYPTARLFHQPAPGDWDEVIDRVAAALASFARP